MHRTPTHIGIIPDGNRRWALANGLQKQDGYAHGLDAGVRLLRAAKAQGVRELTFYGFTVDNCKRPKGQVEAFTAACCAAVERIEAEGVSTYVCGNTQSDCFPSALLPYAERKEDTGKMRINLLVNYGWEWDMKNGWPSRCIPRLDLIVRWGGMRRLSGFLPLQSVYADFFVEDAFWPDYRDEHFTNALAWYARQDITLGG